MSSLTTAEKMAILTALNLGPGHWYTCSNGHIYCVGECGGPEVVARCSECAAPIGKSGSNQWQLSIVESVLYQSVSRSRTCVNGLLFDKTKPIDGPPIDKSGVGGYDNRYTQIHIHW